MIHPDNNPRLPWYAEHANLVARRVYTRLRAHLTRLAGGHTLWCSIWTSDSCNCGAVVMADAQILRRAADLIDEFAKSATPGSWNGHISAGGPAFGAVYGGPWEHGYRTSAVMRWCDEAVQEYGGEPTQADLNWLCLMSPHIAAPLATWLRSAADAADLIGADQRAVAFAQALVGPDEPQAIVLDLTGDWT